MSAGLGIAVTVLLLGVNAFFVAGEFAVTSTRRSQIEPLAEQGRPGSRHALHALRHVSLMLAICQLGVTVASTTLGVVAEPAIAHLVEAPLARAGLPGASAHVVGFAAALAVVLFAHVVFGEMVPKNISLASSVRMLLVLAPVLVGIGRVIRPVITAMDAFANWFVRLAGYEPRAEIASTFTVEEVATIVETSQAEGVLDDELGLLSGALEFSEETAGSTMVPLDGLVVLPASATPADVEEQVARTVSRSSTGKGRSAGTSTSRTCSTPRAPSATSPSPRGGSAAWRPSGRPTRSRTRCAACSARASTAPSSNRRGRRRGCSSWRTSSSSWSARCATPYSGEARARGSGRERGRASRRARQREGTGPVGPGIWVQPHGSTGLRARAHLEVDYE